VGVVTAKIIGFDVPVDLLRRFSHPAGSSSSAITVVYLRTVFCCSLRFTLYVKPIDNRIDSHRRLWFLHKNAATLAARQKLARFIDAIDYFFCQNGYFWPIFLEIDFF